MAKKKICPKCHGTGDPSPEEETAGQGFCTKCWGDGEIEKISGFWPVVFTIITIIAMLSLDKII